MSDDYLRILRKVIYCDTEPRVRPNREIAAAEQQPKPAALVYSCHLSKFYSCKNNKVIHRGWPLWAFGLWLRYAMLQNLIPSFPWIAPPHPPPWHNRRKGRDHFCHLATLADRQRRGVECWKRRWRGAGDNATAASWMEQR